MRNSGCCLAGVDCYHWEVLLRYHKFPKDAVNGVWRLPLYGEGTCEGFLHHRPMLYKISMFLLQPQLPTLVGVQVVVVEPRGSFFFLFSVALLKME